MEVTGFAQKPGINLPHKTMGNPECWIDQKRDPKKVDNQQATMVGVKVMAQKRGTRERQGQKSRRLEEI